MVLLFDPENKGALKIFYQFVKMIVSMIYTSLYLNIPKLLNAVFGKKKNNISNVRNEEAVPFMSGRT